MKTIKLLLRNNLLAKRLLTVKELILEKLDRLLSASEKAERRSQAKFQECQEINDVLLVNTRSILENQVFLLKSSVDTVYAAKESIVKSESALCTLQESIGSILDETGRILDETGRTHHSTNQIHQLVGDSFKAVEQSCQELSKIRQEVLEIKQDSIASNATNTKLLVQIADDVRSQKYKYITDSSHFQVIEIELMAYLYSYLPYRRAIDVGANRGDVAVRLLQAGYEVYAFEPFPPVLEKLKERLANNPDFHSLPYALGAANETREFHLAADLTDDRTYDDPTFYNSLLPHSLAEGLVFTESMPVTVRTLAGLHQSGELPSEVGLVKIDTEGFDLEVIKGMGECRYPVVVAEFWDPSFPFGQSGAMNYIRDMVPAMRQRGYSWHIIVYRIWGEQEISYYCNSVYSFDGSWGNVFFFQDYSVFQEALKWCASVMPATYFGV